jgi:hypothetical protein
MLPSLAEVIASLQDSDGGHDVSILMAAARLTASLIAASARIERWGSRAIAPDGPDTAFACRWLPPSVWKAVNDDSPI